MGLIFFDGGPMDNHAYETSTLLSREALGMPILEYLWTSEKITSENTGATAQVWRHKSKIKGASDVPTRDEATRLAVAQGNSNTLPDNVVPITEAAAAAPPTNGAAEANGSTIAEPAVAPENVNETPETAVTGVVTPPPNVDTEPKAEGSLPSGAYMLDLRKKLKISRNDAAAGSGLAVSKIIAVENDSGKRLKVEEKQQYWAYLFDANGGVRDDAQPAATEAPAEAAQPETAPAETAPAETAPAEPVAAGSDAGAHA